MEVFIDIKSSAMREEILNGDFKFKKKGKNDAVLRCENLKVNAKFEYDMVVKCCPRGEKTIVDDKEKGLLQVQLKSIIDKSIAKYGENICNDMSLANIIIRRITVVDPFSVSVDINKCTKQFIYNDYKKDIEYVSDPIDVNGKGRSVKNTLGL